LGISLLAGCGGGGGGGNKDPLNPTGPTDPTDPTGPGGGGGNPPPANCLSSDYFGLEVNYTLNYDCFLNYPEKGYHNVSYTMAHTVLSEDSGVFKTQKKDSIYPGYPYGDYIGKSADGNYYDIGAWETGEEDFFYYEPYEIIYKNPMSSDFSSGRYGSVDGQENVTVPAGTFNAWKFFNSHDGVDEGVPWTGVFEYYFVENIGLVKYVYTETKNGETVFYETWSLTSYYLSTSASSAVHSFNKSTNLGAFRKLKKT